jgi:hypothetical protein
MSFIGKGTKGTTYNPGYFLAHEECVRVTKEVAQDSALVKTTELGAKYVPMGTPYPTNDGNAIGILYEDVDVTTGNMPGSVVTKGVVIEERLPVTEVTYEAVTPTEGANPKTSGWYEKDGSNYVLTTDETVGEQKTYYEQVDVRLASAAKSALAALGFTFVSESAVTRPY